jgi:hypothetical protein
MPTTGEQDQQVVPGDRNRQTSASGLGRGRGSGVGGGSSSLLQPCRPGPSHRGGMMTIVSNGHTPSWDELFEVAASGEYVTDLACAIATEAKECGDWVQVQFAEQLTSPQQRMSQCRSGLFRAT